MPVGRQIEVILQFVCGSFPKRWMKNQMPPVVSENSAPQQIDMLLAKQFLEKASEAHAAGDTKTFEVARALVLVNLGLSTEIIKV